MNVVTSEFSLSTEKNLDIIDITEKIEEEVRVSGISKGIAVITSQHTTTGIMVNENETGFFEDLRNALKRLAPEDIHYTHDDLHKRNVPKGEPQNGKSHILASIIGGTQTIPIESGKLKLGTWQSVFLVELDSARYRRVVITVIGK